MTAPRLEIDLDKIYHNALTLVTSFGKKGISVTGVTKAVLGLPAIANALLQAGVKGLGDSRIENIETMRRSEVPASMTLIRTPMLSQAEQVVALADVSLNTELDVIRKLSSAARIANRTHGIVLMLEMGDLREGIMPSDLEKMVREVLHLPNIKFNGIGTNLACSSGASPSARNMAELSTLADSLDKKFGSIVGIVSGGNSANLQWALNTEDTGRINNLRLGEAILLGREPLHRQPLSGLHTDAVTLVAEVIESKNKPSKPWGEIAESAFGEVTPGNDRGHIWQSILAIGRQDIDPTGLASPPEIEILSASSDHLVVDYDNGNKRLPVGTEISFQLNYSGVLRAMTSPFVSKNISEPTTASLRAGSPRNFRK